MDWDDIQREFDRVNEMSCKPVGLQKYKVGHIFDENMSVKWNREKLEEENKKYNDEVARLNTEKNKGFCRANDLVYQKIREEVGHCAVKPAVGAAAKPDRVDHVACLSGPPKPLSILYRKPVVKLPP